LPVNDIFSDHGNSLFRPSHCYFRKRSEIRSTVMYELAYTRRGRHGKKKSIGRVDLVEPGHDNRIDQLRQEIGASTSGTRPTTRSSSLPRQPRIHRSRSGKHGNRRNHGSHNRGSHHIGNPRQPACLCWPHPRFPCRKHRMSPD
jgi:hypothetical protein